MKFTKFSPSDMNIVFKELVIPTAVVEFGIKELEMLTLIFYL